jgi:hypothetical protein
MNINLYLLEVPQYVSEIWARGYAKCGESTFPSCRVSLQPGPAPAVREPLERPGGRGRWSGRELLSCSVGPKHFENTIIVKLCLKSPNNHR